MDAVDDAGLPAMPKPLPGAMLLWLPRPQTFLWLASSSRRYAAPHSLDDPRSSAISRLRFPEPFPPPDTLHLQHRRLTPATLGLVFTSVGASHVVSDDLLTPAVQLPSPSPPSAAASPWPLSPTHFWREATPYKWGDSAHAKPMVVLPSHFGRLKDRVFAELTNNPDVSEVVVVVTFPRARFDLVQDFDSFASQADPILLEWWASRFLPPSWSSPRTRSLCLPIAGTTGLCLHGRCCSPCLLNAELPRLQPLISGAKGPIRHGLLWRLTRGLASLVWCSRSTKSSALALPGWTSGSSAAAQSAIFSALLDPQSLRSPLHKAYELGVPLCRASSTSPPTWPP